MIQHVLESIQSVRPTEVYPIKIFRALVVVGRFVELKCPVLLLLLLAVIGR